MPLASIDACTDFQADEVAPILEELPTPASGGHVPKELFTTDIRGQMILLGTGTSVGVPAIGCGCDVCRSDNPRNRRTRCSAILGLPDGNLLIDTSPDVRQQLLREQIGIVHAVVYTHEHADHVFGLDDLRLMQFYLGGAVPLYCELRVEDRIRKSYDYAFKPDEGLHTGAVPQLAFRRIGLEPFEVLGAHVTPIRLKHGTRFDVLGFRIGNVAYCTDANAIPPESMERLTGLDILVLDALRPRGHATHFSLEEAVQIARRLAPRQTYFTHMSHELEHEATNAALPPGMALAYDGLRIELR
jgi:phosphoribosyl 1,2-cyclic phosphate phosphodiesterase